MYSLYKLLTENETELLKALKADGKCENEAQIAEFNTTIRELTHTLESLDDWMKGEKKSLEWLFTLSFDSAKICPEPKGVVLIIGTWNYPVNIVLVPLIGAIAAGNCAVMKLSELSANTSLLLSKLIPKYLDKNCFKAVYGAVEQSTAILKLPWDHILFTGGTKIGKIVAKAAAEHLTPCTLELGGKR